MCQKYLYSYYIIFVYARKEVILQRFIKEKPPNRTMKIINPKNQYIMKHKSTISANGLHTPPCGSSHGNLSSFNLRYSLLMLFLLLIVGTNAAWGWEVRGRGLTGLTVGSGTWAGDNNYVTMTDAGNNLYYAVFQNQAARSDNEYRYKICDGWKGTNYYDSSKGNVNLVSADETQISFTLPVASDVYIFYNSSTDKTWTIALPTRISDYDSDFYIKQDLSISSGSDGRNSSFGWASGSKALHLSHKADGGFTKYTVGVVIPSTMKWRYEMPSINSKPSVSKTTVDKSGSSIPILYFMGWDGSSSSFTCLAEIPNPSRKKGWTLYEKKSGESYHSYSVADNGSVTVEGLAPGNHYFYFANANNTIHRHGVDWFGGLYVKNSECSGVTTYSNTYYHTNKIGTVSKSIPHENCYNYDNQCCYIDSTGYFTLADGHTYDVTFTFDGGKITINAVDHVETFTDEVYVYGAGGTNWVTGWSKPVEDYKMTISGGVASKTFYNVKGNGLNFKVWNKTTSSDIDWSKYDSSQSDVTCTNCSSNNICFDLAQNSDVTVYTDGEKVWVKVQARQTITSDYYLQGDYNGWHTWTDAYKFTKVDNYTQRITKRWSPSDFTTCAGLSRCKILRSDDDWGNAITINGIHAETSSYTSQTDCEGGDTRICVKLTQTSDVTYTIWKNSNGDKKVSINVVPVVVRTVTFNTDGGSSIDNANVENGQTVTRPSDPSKGGYAFVNWYSDSEKTVLYDFGTPVTADITLYAKWEAAETRRITFVTNGGTAVDPVDLTKGTKLSSYPSTSYGNGTVTWCTDEGLTTAFDKDNTNINEDITLYAKWGVSGNFYLVGDFGMHDKGSNWAYNSGLAMTTTDGVASVTYVAPKGRHRFEILTGRSSWPAIANQGSGLIAASTPTLSWSNEGAGGYYHFRFDLDAPKKVTVRYDGKVSVTAEDYVVAKTGWTVASKSLFGHGSEESPDNADDGSYMSGYNMTEGQMNSDGELVIRNLNAGTYKFWIGKYNTALNKQKQNIEVFGAAHVDKSNSSLGGYGSLANVSDDTYNQSIPMDDKLHRRVQFTLTQTASIKIAFDGGKITVNLLPRYTVSFNSNGGSEVASQSVFEGATASEPGAPTKAGCNFVKWQLSGADYNFSSAVNGNITLDAVWANKPIESVALNESSHTTWVGNSDFVLTLTKNPSDLITKSIVWSSDDTGVASVDGGTVHAAGVGTATITCTVTDMFDNVRSATCEVTVAACEMTTDDLYSMTVTGYNSSTGSSATLNGLWNESSDNDGPAELKAYYLPFSNNSTDGSIFAYDDNGVVKVKSDKTENTSTLWYFIKAGNETFTPSFDNLDGHSVNTPVDVYYVKNKSTNRYLHRGSSEELSGDWKFAQTLTSSSIDNNNINNYKWVIIQPHSGAFYMIPLNMSKKSDGNNIYNAFHLHTCNQYNEGSFEPANYKKPYLICGRQSDNNRCHGIYNFNLNNPDVTEPNPAYIQSQMNSSYYRMKENATVQANLANGLVYGSVITVRLYADAATSVKLQTAAGDDVETIDLNADAAREFTYTVAYGSELVGATAFIIKAADNHAGIASIEVSRMHAVSPADPVLAWESDLSSGVTQSALAGTFQHVASSALSGGAIHYTSSDEAVATVAADGTVTPIMAGNTTITATIEQRECYAEASISYNVTLTEPTLAELIAADAGEGITLTHDYAENIVIDKEITINGGGHSIGNLKVETAGDLTLSGALTVNDFSIYAKAGNSEHQAESGQVRNATNLTANGNAYFYYTVDPNGHVQYGWYDFTVPFPVDVMTGIKGIQESVLKENFVNETDYAIMEFLGDNKAEGKYAYKKFRGVMQPNQLYSITLDCSYNYNLIRFQKTNSGALVADESMALPGHEGAEATKNNWNGVGNGTLHHVNIGGVGATTIQVYQSGDKSFLPVTISDHSLAIGTAFMIQGTETMVFSQANHALLAPRRAAEVQPMTVQIAREEQPFSDQLFIGADELAGQGYMQGVDVAKAGDLGSAKVAQIWVNAYNSKLCAHEAQLINGRAKYALSLYAPADGTYTLTGMNIPEGSTLYLTKNGKVIWNLGYTCDLDLTKGIATEYGLLLVQSPQISTGVDNIHSDANDTKKIMHNGILYILHNGKVFNAQGACVE